MGRISDKDWSKFSKVWALHGSTRHTGERTNAYTAAYRIARKYGHTPETFSQAWQAQNGQQQNAPPPPPRQQQRQESHQEAPRTDYRRNARPPRSDAFSGQSGRRSQPPPPRQEPPPDPRFGRDYGPPPHMDYESDAYNEWVQWQYHNPNATADEMWRKWGQLWPPVGPTYGRPSTYKPPPEPDSYQDVIAALAMAALVIGGLSFVTFLALTGWLGYEFWSMVWVMRYLIGALLAVLLVLGGLNRGSIGLFMAGLGVGALTLFVL